jgi:hypothetical protein
MVAIFILRMKYESPLRMGRKSASAPEQTPVFRTLGKPEQQINGRVENR